MPRQTRHATDAVGESAYPTIVNQGYVSDYYLAYRLDAGLADLYERWEQRERNGDATARVRVRSLSTALAKFRVDASRTAPDPPDDGDDSNTTAPSPETLDEPLVVEKLDRNAVGAQRDLNDALADALGWTPDHPEVTLIAGDTEVTVPVIHRRDTASGLLLLAIGTVFATDPTTVVASKRAPAGTLLESITVNDRVVARTALEAAPVIFGADEPPTYLLVCSGASITLLDRNRWGEGAYLGANLDDAIARADHRPKGELAAIAALFSADGIDPGTDAQSALATLIDNAAKESAGVSKELRHGVRRSVEVLANAVVRDVRHRQKQAWKDIDPDELTRECLRYLYRIIVLLYAEARPELAILPVDDADYQSGYSIARLRDVALVDLHAPQATEATHIQQSLAVLFALVNDGHQPDYTLTDVRAITFPGLRSALFGPDACPMIDRARIPDSVMQQVLTNLCFSREQRGRHRQSLSYATLGINQLGAVYEGLMAFRGFLATEPLYEVDNDGDPDSGTWVIPVRKADEFPDTAFVTEPGSDGQPRRVAYEEGDFVFRLAGRDRQRSASYYTPEVLTEFTVRHALDVYEEEHPDLSAADWLAVTVCEPALGSGAFANEAINQLATRYLKSAQDERSEIIDADQYQLELQRVKAHFAINRAHGVDLNRTAVELAEVSLWLNVMHDGLNTPRFDARLRRGNSLIGARRATYTAEQVTKAPWKGTSARPVAPPTDVPLHEVPLGEAPGIHHFLLPGEGWGAAADAVELKGKKGQPGLAEAWSQAVRDWRRVISKPPTKAQLDRAAALARRVETAWAVAARHAGSHLRAHEQRIDVWGADPTWLPDPGPTDSSVDFQSFEGPTARLRCIMDAWCALWMWAPANGDALPTSDQWLNAIELLLGQPTADETGTLFRPLDLAGDAPDRVEHFGTATIAEVRERHPWLEQCRRISETQAFFHWELEFAPVFAAGGFDLQVGNPPWVRPTWDEPASLAEHDPWWVLTDLNKAPDGAIPARRSITLTDAAACTAVVADRAENHGLNALLGAVSREPLLAGVQTNLYMVFMTNTWRRATPRGVVGLLHPESHFVDPKAGPLRATTYGRLRRHWQFANEAKLFPDVHNEREFGAHIYASLRSPSFLQAVNLLTPSTVDRSLAHDGSGEVPGIQFPEGGWDLRPHRQRVVTVDHDVLAQWVALFDEPGTLPIESRLMRPLTHADLESLAVFAVQRQRLGQTDRYWTAGFHEKGSKDDGTIEWSTAFPPSLGDCVLQGPHILNATPFAQQPREGCQNNKDWEAVDLETLPPDFIPRTNYRRLVDPSEFLRRQTEWSGEPFTTRYREAHREFVGAGSVRTMQACILPPNPCHVHAVNSIGFASSGDLVLWSGFLASLPIDYFVKVAGLTHITVGSIDNLPFPPVAYALRHDVGLRVLRLNCVTEAYATLWGEQFDERWLADRFVAADGTVHLGDVDTTWSTSTPLRTERDRWLALTEIDALVALALGLSEAQLLQMYRSQFAVLRKYEYVTVFDANGRQISEEHHNYGYIQSQWEADLKTKPVKRGERRVGMWQRVQQYLGGDTSVDLGPFVPPFVPADRELAMSTAYRAFAQRMADA